MLQALVYFVRIHAKNMISGPGTAHTTQDVQSVVISQLHRQHFVGKILKAHRPYKTIDRVYTYRCEP